MRLDRWFHVHFPELGFGHLQKLIRSGQVRVDGGRVKTNTRLEPGQAVRVPPLAEPGAGRRGASPEEQGSRRRRPVGAGRGDCRATIGRDRKAMRNSCAPSSFTRTTMFSSSTSLPALRCRAAPA